MYQALYRKWRPQTFSDVVGQEHITETLRRQIETGKLSHAYLFVGTRGTGKTTCAKILAKAVNCEHPVNGNPCNECTSCRGINSGAVLDVEELDAASNNGVDNIRALRDEAVYTPASVRKRVYIIDEVHMLSTSAFNALLKILEEPPEHLIFILATTELHKVPATILSRCQRFSFKRITPEETAKRLKFVANEEKMQLTDDGAELLSILAEGSLRDALSLLDQCASQKIIDRERILSVVGLAGAEETARLAKSILSGDITQCLTTLDRLYSEGREIGAVLSELMSLYRDALVYKVTRGKKPELFAGRNELKTVAGIAQSADSKRLLRGVSIIEETLEKLARSSDVKTEAEMCLISLADETLLPEIAGLEARVSRLEAGLVNPPMIRQPIPVQPENDDRNNAPFDTEDAVPTEKPASKSEKPEKKTDDNESDECWKTIVSQLGNKVSPAVRSFLTNPSCVTAQISDSEVCVTLTSAIAKRIVDKEEVKLAVKETAQAVLGRAVTVSFGGAKSPEAKPSEDKLNSLSRFGNIKFE